MPKRKKKSPLDEAYFGPTNKSGFLQPVGGNRDILYHTCCDCGLRHVIEINVNRHHFVHMKFWRDDSGTAVIRAIRKGKLVRRKR